jgi:hypothetical protein
MTDTENYIVAACVLAGLIIIASVVLTILICCYRNRGETEYDDVKSTGRISGASAPKMEKARPIVAVNAHNTILHIAQYDYTNDDYTGADDS